MANEKDDHAHVVAPPPLIYAGGLALGLVLQRIKSVPFLPRAAARAVGWPLVGLGLLFGVSALATMRRAQTSPLPDVPSTALVETGPYRYTRNPIYVAFTLMYTGIALLNNAIWPLLLLPGVIGAMVRGVIEREEAYLERRFGPSYTSYKARVRRWL